MARVSRKTTAAESARPVLVRTYRVAAYVRLSDEDIRKKISDSIGTQKAMLMDFIERHSDLRLYGIYEDVNYTGTNFNRPGFTRMIEDIQAGLVDCVLVKDLSRFGRSFEEMGHYLERVFPFLEVRFISVGDGYDSLTATLDESSLIVPLKNLMNEVYARDISRKVQSSVKLRQKRGQFVGSIAPYGYIKDGASFTVDEEAAEIVRQIFGWILDGYSDIAIAGMLNERRIPSPSRHRFEKGITKAKRHEDARFWYKSAVKRISENPAYIGVLAQAKYQSGFLCGSGRIKNERDEWIIVEDAHPAIIDSAIFEAVHEIRDARKRNYKVNENHVTTDNIFKGLIVCGDCKGCMSRQRLRRIGGDVYFFGCNVYDQVDKNACKKKKVMEADIEAALFAYISREISLAVDMCRILSDMQSRDSFHNKADLLEKHITALHKKLQHNRRFRGSLREDYKDGVLTEQDYVCMKSDYDEEKERLERELDALLCEKHRQATTLSPDNKWIAEFRRFETERQLSAGMVTALVERIEVYDSERIEITLRHRDEFETLWAYVNNCDWEARAVNE